MKLSSIIITASMLLLSQVSLARIEPISFTYISLGGSNGERELTLTNPFDSSETDTADADYNGFLLQGSWSLADNFYLYGGFEGNKSDKYSSKPLGNPPEPIELKVDYYRSSVGLGFNLPVFNNSQMLLRGNYEAEKYDTDNLNFKEFINTDTESGFSLLAGIRSQYARGLFETGFYLEHIDTYDARTGGIIDARVRTGRTGASLGLNARFNDEATLWGFDFRFEF